MKQSVIIVAGGSGSRMNTEIPKQFLLLNDRPVLFYSLEAFYNYNPDIQILLVLPHIHIDFWKSLCKEFDLKIKHKIIEGGNTRFVSVKNGLSAIEDNCFVAVHDGARPLITADTIHRLFEKAKKYGNVIPVVDVNESIREISIDGNKIADRSKFKLVQTPQIFKSEDLHAAYKQEYKIEFTDDASVVETLGIKIHLAKGQANNLKITQPSDLKIAEAFLKL